MYNVRMYKTLTNHMRHTERERERERERYTHHVESSWWQKRTVLRTALDTPRWSIISSSTSAQREVTCTFCRVGEGGGKTRAGGKGGALEQTGTGECCMNGGPAALHINGCTYVSNVSVHSSFPSLLSRPYIPVRQPASPCLSPEFLSQSCLAEQMRGREHMNETYSCMNTKSKLYYPCAPHPSIALGSLACSLCPSPLLCSNG